MSEGSSPLTRGKRSLPTCGRHRCGLIPAHAGKTAPSNNTAASHPAHPRSRGENADFTVPDLRGRGSSPLTRGKRSGVSRSRLMRGLIPAHAGKTSARCGSSPPMRAHPRSRGENGQRTHLWDSPMGSSPLTRGKPPDRLNHRADPGLIPAHAGKTIQPRECRAEHRAHPRSRGENTWRLLVTQMSVGSSPLTRGKLTR